jgi:hypothetical protein
VSVVRGKPHAAFEAAGAGNVAWSKYWDTRNRKGEQQGIQTSTYTGAPALDPTGDVNSVRHRVIAVAVNARGRDQGEALGQFQGVCRNWVLLSGCGSSKR